VTVVDVAHVRMRVRERLVMVFVRMRFPHICSRWMHVPVVSVVDVEMIVIDRFVHVDVLVVLAEQHDHPYRHERARE
jgi:hypothetical protein